MLFERTVAIGLGGIWARAWDFTCERLAYQEDIPKLIRLMDGDDFSESNMGRQSIREGDIAKKKVAVRAAEIRAKYPGIELDECPKFLVPKNIKEFIQDRSIILCCVDNNKTRKLVSMAAQKLNDVVVITGGNEMTDGNAYLYIRFDGVDLTKRIEDTHEEIMNPTDKNPGELSCEERARLPGGGQLARANSGAGFNVGLYFSRILESCSKGKEEVEKLKKVSEVFFDTETFVMSSFSRAARKPRTRKGESYGSDGTVRDSVHVTR